MAGRRTRAAWRLDGERVRFGALVGFLAIVFLLGGGARDDIQSLVLLRPLAVVFGAYALSVATREDVSVVRGPLLLLGALAGYLLLQLLPLPAALWHLLGGRSVVIETDRIAGLADAWRPISLSPSKTWNSLVSLTVPAAALLLAAVQRGRRSGAIVLTLLAIAALSILLGLLQMAGPADGPLYFYRITNPGGPVGLFANRNHHAFFLDGAIVLAAWYFASGRGNPQNGILRQMVAIPVILLGSVVVLACGTRAGFALLIVALIAGYLLLLLTRGVPIQHRRRARQHRIRERLALYAAPAAALVIAVLVLVFHDRIPALQRLASGNTGSDVRFQVLPTLLEMARDNLPFGSGFGSFEHVFKVYEPDAALAPSYLNQAHNDWLQIAIEGGLPAVALLAVALVGYARRWPVAARALRWPDRVPETWLPAAVLTAIGLIGLASAGDYPLRVPSLMAFVAVCTVLALRPGGAPVPGLPRESR